MSVIPGPNGLEPSGSSNSGPTPAFPGPSGEGTTPPPAPAPAPSPINVAGGIAKAAQPGSIPNSAANGLAGFLGAESSSPHAVGFDPNLANSSLVLNYGSHSLDLLGSVASATLQRTISGASTLTLTVEDPHREVLNNPVINIIPPITPIALVNGQPASIDPSTPSPASISTILPGANGLGSTLPDTPSSGIGPVTPPATALPGPSGVGTSGAPTGSTSLPGSSAAAAQAAPGSDVASNAAGVDATPYTPTTLSITDGTNSITFALVQVSKTGDQLTLTFEDILINELRFCFPLAQGANGLQSAPPAPSTTGTDTSSAGNIPAGGEQVGATIYGGPGDPGSGTTGAGGNLVNTYAFAELSTNPSAPLNQLDYSALGNLPMGTLLSVTYNGRTVIAEKLDRGAGGGPINGVPRAIDLWYQTAQALGMTGSEVVTIAPAPAGAQPGLVADTGSSANAGVTSGAGSEAMIANTGAASGQTRADFMAMVINTGLSALSSIKGSQVVNPQLAYPPDGTPEVDPVQEQLTWGGNGTSTASGSTSSPGVSEDAWSCLVRLANEVQWRVFSDGTAIWFGPDGWLLSGPVAATFAERETANSVPASVNPPVSVADDIDFDWDIGKAQATLTVNTTADLLTFPPGRVLSIWNCGLASGATAGGVGAGGSAPSGPSTGGTGSGTANTSSGPLWLVSDINRQELIQPDVTIECVQAQPEITEAMAAAQASGSTTAAQPAGTNTTAAIGGGGSAAAQKAAQAAVSQVGTPYVSGGSIPGVGFDCSGLTQWAYSQAGVSIPRTSQAQYAAAFPKVNVDPGSLVPGDLLYSQFGVAGPGPDHVGMYIGNNQVVQSPHPGATVFVGDLNGSAGTWQAANRPTAAATPIVGQTA